MEITLYRYIFQGATWAQSGDLVSRAQRLAEKLNESTLQGDEPADQFGFIRCGAVGTYVYGIFVQRFLTHIRDVDSVTKAELSEDTTNRGDYLFIIALHKHEAWLQARRHSELPSRERIELRFKELLQLVMGQVGMGFSEIADTHDITDRDRIVHIFYQEADRVTAMEFTDFDPVIIESQKRLRGGTRQKYFNPIEEYQEAMEESAIRFARNVERSEVKAKEGADLRKDPLTRAMLEGSRVPSKITYTKNSEVISESGVTRRKLVITVEGGVSEHLDDKIGSILARLGEEPPLERREGPQLDLFE
jgi:hypothetical protein